LFSERPHWWLQTYTIEPKKEKKRFVVNVTNMNYNWPLTMDAYYLRWTQEEKDTTWRNSQFLHNNALPSILYTRANSSRLFCNYLDNLNHVGYCYNVTSHGKLNQISSYVINYISLCRPYGYIAFVVGSTNILFSLSLCFLVSSVQKFSIPLSWRSLLMIN
jgi:hypothetical protein